MATEIIANQDQQLATTVKKRSNVKLSSDDAIGTIGVTIGTGENAKDSIVYLTIKWAFFIGAGITVIITLNTWFFTPENQPKDLIGEIKSSWQIVIPIITLVLGYYFGKSSKSNTK